VLRGCDAKGAPREQIRPRGQESVPGGGNMRRARGDLHRYKLGQVRGKKRGVREGEELVWLSLEGGDEEGTETRATRILGE